MRKGDLIRGLIAGLLIIQSLTSAADEVRVVAVIVSAQSALESEFNPNELALIYWRKKLYGAHGQVLRPVNLHAEHPVRVHFSNWVLHSSPAAQLGYWNGLYFHGVQPPYSVQSEEAMIRYVAENEHAIGYIDACHLDSRVKAVAWVTASKISSESPALRCESGN